MGLGILLIIAMLFSAGIGAVSISVKELANIFMHKMGLFSGLTAAETFKEPVLMVIRLPRVILGVLVGATLGITGAAMQGLFRNPLAEPGLIGISAGAALFAAGMIVLPFGFIHALNQYLGHYSLMLAAFVGACLSAFAVYRLAVTDGRASIATLLLAGIAINALSGSITGLFTYLSTDEQLRSITFWSMGSLGGASWGSVLSLLPFVGVPLIIIPIMAKAMNAFSLGEQQAGYLGINAGRIKRLVLIITALGVGASVALAGIIGFIGLVIPHILRMAFGSDHRLILPGSALLGALVLTLSDLLSRTIVAPAELPIGIVTAIFGTPVFIYIIFREKKKNFV